jgi:hexosaminidase
MTKAWEASTVVPAPRTIVPGNETAALPPRPSIGWDEASELAARSLLRRIPGATRGMNSTAISVSTSPNAGPADRYVIDIDNAGIRIVGSTPAGAFYGVQTLLQMIPPDWPVGGDDDPLIFRAVHVEDHPSFAWRGLMIDVSRHFFSLDFLYKVIDLMALHRMSVLHLHLTDDQGWRVEIEGYPRLTEMGAWRPETVIVGQPWDVANGHFGDQRFDGTPHGGFYTQSDLRMLVEYASERLVEIVPEIDMPGHMMAAIAAYPSLGNGFAQPVVQTKWDVSEHILNLDPQTIEFCKTVLTQIASIFPSCFVHGGGDEVPKGEWKRSSSAQALMLELGLKDEEHLQGWFQRLIGEHLATMDRRYLGWDEILETGDLPPGGVVMAWRDNRHGLAAARRGIDTVLAPRSHYYFDMYQAADRSKEPLAFGGLSRLRQVYEFEPLAELDSASHRKHILGLEAALWTEYIKSPEQAEYMLFPRICAFAERAWDHDSPKDYRGFLRRLRGNHLARLNKLGVGYRNLGIEDE